MSAESNALPQTKRVVKGQGLQPRRLLATGRKLRRPSGEGFHQFCQPIHCNICSAASRTIPSPLGWS